MDLECRVKRGDVSRRIRHEYDEVDDGDYETALCRSGKRALGWGRERKGGDLLVYRPKDLDMVSEVVWEEEEEGTL